RVASLLPPVGTEVFRRFTPASLEEIQEQHEAKRSLSFVSKETEKAPSTDMAAGKPLPFFYGDPPPELLTTPLEELDPFYQSQKTFMVLSEGNIVHRFHSESICFPLRTFFFFNKRTLFSVFILVTLLINCVFMLLRVPGLSTVMELIFMVIYTLEALVKVVSRGLCLGRFTFLRDPWNWLDLLIITTGLVELVLADIEGLPVLRCFRVVSNSSSSSSSWLQV
uniref:Ion transport domain-containing protein n=1 Tax=Stegastes partitus TaxID=144197 RepID=A0A3B4Z6I1_9TELE